MGNSVPPPLWKQQEQPRFALPLPGLFLASECQETVDILRSLLYYQFYRVAVTLESRRRS